MTASYIFSLDILLFVGLLSVALENVPRLVGKLSADSYLLQLLLQYV